MNSDDYEAGKQAGRIEALEAMAERNSERLDGLEASLRTQERITYGLLGAIAFIQIVPLLKGVLE